LVGRARTLEMAFAHDPVAAPEAHRLGLVNRVVEPGELDSAALAWAHELSQLPLAAVGELKALVDRAHDGDLRAHVAADTQAVARTAASADFEEGLEAFFAKRPARFGGR
jgi:2-(1,2-epoxy-1,2-dihydrophenyl)acetyl-CoA isomerase